MAEFGVQEGVINRANQAAIARDVNGDGKMDLEVYTSVDVEPGFGVKAYLNPLGRKTTF